MEIVEHKGLLPKTIDEALKLSNVLADSNIIPKDFQRKPGDIFVAVNWGIEIGLAPMQALQNIAVINGRPSIWGDAALALVRGSGKLEYIEEKQTDTEATCKIKRKGEPEAVYTFTKVDAERAGLWDTRAKINKNNYQMDNPSPWYKYPKRMMQMRARSFALRDIFTDVLKGVGIAEEEQDKAPIDTTVETYAEVEPVDPLANASEENLQNGEKEEATDAIIEEPEEEAPKGRTVEDITKLYNQTPTELKPKVLNVLSEGWREETPEQLETYYDKIMDILL